MENMKAVRVHNYGGPEVLRFEDAPRPTPGSGELLIRVHAASVNPIDWKIRAGYMNITFPFPCHLFRAGTFPVLSKQWVPASPNLRRAMKSMPARMLPLTVTALTRNTSW